jgi:hypothetical protein
MSIILYYNSDAHVGSCACMYRYILYIYILITDGRPSTAVGTGPTAIVLVVYSRFLVQCSCSTYIPYSNGSGSVSVVYYL